VEVKIFKPERLAESAGEKLTELFQKNRGREILLLLAGGSAMETLQYIKPEALGTHITIVMLDERWSADPKVCNFLQLKALPFYELAVEAGVNIFDTSPEDRPRDSLGSRTPKTETRKELAARWEEFLREWVAENPKGKVIATFGIGEDGHICGVMPFPEDPQKFSGFFENDRRFVAGYDAGAKTKFPLRITATFSFLRKYLTEGVVFVSGEKKRTALAHVLGSRGTLPETPARILRELTSVTIFTDLR